MGSAAECLGASLFEPVRVDIITVWAEFSIPKETYLGTRVVACSKPSVARHGPVEFQVPTRPLEPKGRLALRAKVSARTGACAVVILDATIGAGDRARCTRPTGPKPVAFTSAIVVKRTAILAL
jgi:hypothetical protein